MKNAIDLDELGVRDALTNAAEQAVPHADVRMLMWRKLAAPKSGLFARQRAGRLATLAVIGYVAIFVFAIFAALPRGKEAVPAPFANPPAAVTVAMTHTAAQWAVAALPPADLISYTVAAGDTFIGIAQRFGMSLDELKQINRLTAEWPVVGEKIDVRQRAQPLQPRELLRIQNGRGIVLDSAWTPDGKAIALSTYTGVYFFDPATLQELRHVQAEDNVGQHISFSPDGSRMVTRGMLSSRRMATTAFQVWNVASGQVIATYAAAGEPLVLSRDGAWFASFTLDGLHVQAVGGGKARFTAPSNQKVSDCYGVKDASRMAFSPDGRRIACASSTGVEIWSALTGAYEFTLSWGAVPGSVGNLTWSADSQRIAASDQGQWAVWDVPTGRTLLVEARADQAVTWLALSPDGARIAYFLRPRSASDGQLAQPPFRILVRDVMTGKTVSELVSESDRPSWAEFSPDGTRLFSAAYAAISVWDVETGRLLVRNNDAFPDRAFALAFDRAGKRIAAGGLSRGARVWDTTSGQWLATAGAGSNVGRILFSPDDATLALSEISRDGSIGELRLYNAGTGKFVRSLARSRESAIAFAPDGESLLFNSFDGIGLMRTSVTETRQFPDSVIRHDRVNRIMGSTLSRDALRYAEPRTFNVVDIWGVNTATLLRIITNTTALSNTDQSFGPIWLSLSDDGSRLMWVTWRDGVSVWDTNSGVLISQLPKETAAEGAFVRAALSPSGRYVAIALSNGNAREPLIQVWDVVEQRYVMALRGHRDTIGEMTFSADGTRLASSSNDGTIRVWNVGK